MGDVETIRPIAGGGVSDHELWTLVAGRLYTGAIPSATSAQRTRLEPSETGRDCDLCGLPLKADEAHIEAEIPALKAGSPRALLAHRECHRVWIELSRTATYLPAGKAH